MRILYMMDNYLEDQTRLDPFKNEVLKALIKASDEALFIQTNDFMTHYGQFKGASERKKVLDVISRYRPEFVVTLNRAGLNKEVQDTIRAPISSWFIDNPDRLPAELLDFAPNETLFCATKHQQQWIADHTKGRIEAQYLPFSTNPKIFFPIEKGAVSKTCDVSFVGTLYDHYRLGSDLEKILQTDEDQKDFIAMLQRYLADSTSPIGKILKERFRFTDPEFLVQGTIDDYISGRDRLLLVAALAHLKLEVYGTKNWVGRSLAHSIELFSKCSVKQIFSAQELTALYRRSKVCLSHCHFQARSGFSLRVYDILASGTPLLTDRHSELEELFKEGETHLGYGSPEEARVQAERLIKDTALSDRLAQNARTAVIEKHTYDHRANTLLLGQGKKTAPSSREYSHLSKYHRPNHIQSELAAEGFGLSTQSLYVPSTRFLGGRADKPIRVCLRAIKMVFGGLFLPLWVLGGVFKTILLQGPKGGIKTFKIAVKRFVGSIEREAHEFYLAIWK